LSVGRGLDLVPMAVPLHIGPVGNRDEETMRHRSYGMTRKHGAASRSVKGQVQFVVMLSKAPGAGGQHEIPGRGQGSPIPTRGDWMPKVKRAFNNARFEHGDARTRHLRRRCSPVGGGVITASCPRKGPKEELGSDLGDLDTDSNRAFLVSAR